MASLMECEAPVIEFLDGIAMINGLTIMSSDAVELLRRMEAREVQSLVDSLLATIAKVAEGATTAQLIMEEFKEQIQTKTKEEFEVFRKEVVEELKAFNKGVGEELEKVIDETLKELRERDEGLAEKIDANSKELKKIIEEKVLERLHSKLEEIQERFALEEKEREIRDKTTLKGLDFQRAVYEECKALLESSGEVVDYVADRPGALKRKTGDILIQHSLHEKLNPRTVVECKDKNLNASGNASEILAEIEEALANRKADACLYLFKTSDQMPESFSPIKVGEGFIVASCETDLWLLLRIAKLIGGIGCRIRGSQEGIDVEASRNELRKIFTYLKELEEIQRLSQLAIGHAEKIHEKAGELRKKIEGSVNKALQGLTEEF